MLANLSATFERAAANPGLSATDLRAFLLFQSAWLDPRLNAAEQAKHARASVRFLRKLALVGV